MPDRRFPDLDAALAARGIALKAARSSGAEKAHAEPPPENTEPWTDAPKAWRPHPAAYAGAVLGLALIALLVFSVVRVSDASMRPPAPAIPAPSDIAGPPAPAAATPAPEAPAPLVAAPPAAPPPPPAAPPEPVNEPALVARTAVVDPPLVPEANPQERLRSKLHTMFPRVFTGP
jgi:hypothetical protein